MSFHQLLVTQTSITSVHGTCTKPEPQATQNVQSQTVRISDAVARDSRGFWELKEPMTTRLEGRSHYLHVPQA